MSEFIAKVAVENTAYSFDDAFDYAIPDLLFPKIKAGVRVLVPFGSSNKKRQGFVFAVREKNCEKKLKSIYSVLDESPLLSNELLRLAVYLKEQTFCTLFDACKAMLPTGLGLKEVKSYILNPSVSQGQIESLTSQEQEVVNYLKEKSVYVKEEKILKDLGFNKDFNIVSTLCSNGYLLSNSNLVRRTGDATVKTVRLTQFYLNCDEKPKLTAKQKEIVNLLSDISSASVKEICYFTGITPAVITTLAKKGIVEVFESKLYRKPNKSAQTVQSRKDIVLSSEQGKTYADIKKQLVSQKSSTALLFGVTGSGKTQVFLKLIDDAVDMGKSVIMMVPEISLTPQMLSIFYERYGDEVAVFHSGLSMGERKDEWQKVVDGKAKIALGTRSAVFAPFKNLGLIVIDEEQEQTYKSEMTPRYNAKNVAAFRSKYNGSLLLLSSATPSVSTFASAVDGKISLHRLDKRYGNAILPEVIMSERKYGAANQSGSNLSPLLEELINENLAKQKQTILLLNRRGFNTFAVCSECGKIKVCPNCSISMTYHSKNKRLMCHYCGYSEPFTKLCSECSKESVVYSGSGTQRLEDELSEKFPNARVLRLDTDSASSRFYFENSLKDFSEGKYDIMLGTQMVAKGLDFPNVTLVGVISIDQQLFNDDYKSAERAFDLITQVVGRAGRGDEKGKAVIQTSFPENEIIKLAAKQDYDSFYKLEIKIRKSLIYPPYCDFCSVGFLGEDEILTRNAAKSFYESVKQLHKSEYEDLGIILLSPLSPRISKVSGKFRYRVIIKCKNTARLREFISRLLKDFYKDKRFKSVTAFADINPENMF